MEVAPPPDGVEETLSLPRDLTEDGVAPFCWPPEVSGVGSDLKWVKKNIYIDINLCKKSTPVKVSLHIVPLRCLRTSSYLDLPKKT